MNQLYTLIEMALKEDIGSGDITSEAIVSKTKVAEAAIIAKQTLILAGIDVAQKVFEMIDPKINFEAAFEDGSEVQESSQIAKVVGPARAILAAERTAINFLQHLSGIATFTRMFVETVSHTKVKILDTRKTTPGYRSLEKHAVLMGDAQNHRLGLFDRYLIKSNHIELAGSVEEAVGLAKAHRKGDTLIEVETKDLDQVAKAVRSGADVVMLDNMSVPEARAAVEIAKGKTKIEVSGNISLENIMSYATIGADYISVGALTHSAPAADISMKISI